MKTFRSCWPLGLLILAAGCGSAEIVIPERQATPLDLTKVGSVSGKVQFAGEAPPRQPIRLRGYAACSRAHEEPPLDESVIVNDGRLKNVFVYVQKGLEGRVFPIPEDPVVMDQKGCIYTPHVAGVQVYQPILFLNSDSLLHNVHSEPKGTTRPFNFAMPVAGTERRVQFTSEEIGARVKCDVHGWMSAYLGVVDHPYFAVSAGDGTYRIENLPPGEYTLEAWHETYGTRKGTVTLEEKGSVRLDFEFAPPTSP